MGPCFIGAEGRSYAHDPVIRLARPASGSNSSSSNPVNPVESEEVTGKVTEGEKVGEGDGSGGVAKLAEAEVDERTTTKEFVSNL
jgi:hypothetical protein